MIWNRSIAAATAISALVLAGSPAGAQGITEERIQSLIREAAARAGVPSTTGSGSTQATAATPGQGDRPVLRLTLQDAISLVLERNLDIAVQRLNPQTFDFSLAGLRSVYRPTITSTLSQQSSTTASTTTTQGQAAGSAINAGNMTWNGVITQSLPWKGASLSATLNNNRQTTSSLTALFDPAYNTNWSATYTQPLLKNFRIDSTRENLVITKLNQDISEIQLQATIINTLSNVRNAYWDYVFAVQSVEVAQRSVELADQLVRDNEMRVEIGAMAEIDIVQAKSQAATQRQNLATAQGTRRTNELTLKRLIVNGTQDPNWEAVIVPADSPAFEPQRVDAATAVRKALEARTDLAQVRKNLQVNEVTLKYLSDQSLPQADLSARYQLTGQGGTSFITSGSGINRVIVDTIPGGYSDALNGLLKRAYPTWNVSLNVTYPLGTSSQDASLARAKLQENQVEAQLRQIELQIATDVTNAATNVQSTVERVQAAQAAHEFAQKQLEAEQAKFEVGMSTNYFVVQAQRDLATSENNELQAILAYRRAIVEVERLQQTSLTSSNITILGR